MTVMLNYLVGVDGENTPDPQYWRDRNEIIEAEYPDQAKEIWLKMREGWYAGEPVTVADIREVISPAEKHFASRWKFQNGKAVKGGC